MLFASPFARARSSACVLNAAVDHFRKFSSIENLGSNSFMRRLYSENLEGGEWVVLEKIHGANFALILGDELKAAKRTGLLAPGDKFYNWENLVEKLKPQMLKLKASLAAWKPSSLFTVYGEFFGGIYPHPDVPRISDVPHIQKGIFYSPDHHFYAFDIHDVSSHSQLVRSTSRVITTLTMMTAFAFSKRQACCTQSRCSAERLSKLEIIQTRFQRSLLPCLDFPKFQTTLLKVL